MSKREKIIGEYHEHPLFKGQYHWAMWVKTWASTGSSDEAPDDAPISCAICGRLYATSGYVAVEPLIAEEKTHTPRDTSE